MKKKYNWEEIRVEYELGKSNSYLHKKYEIPYSTLSNKIKRGEWEVGNKETTAISNFQKSCEQISTVIEDNENNKVKQEAIIDKISTSLKDNKIISNNRTLSLELQRIIGKAIEDDEITSSNVSSITGALKNLESIANPINQSVQVNVQNVVLTDEEKREHYNKRRRELLDK